MAEQPLTSSPTRRAAADHREIELVERSHAFINLIKLSGQVKERVLKPEHILPSAQSCADSQTTLTQSAGEDWVSLSEIEGRYVARVLEHTGGNKQAAARILAVDRKTLDRMIKRHHIETPHFRQRARASNNSGN